MLKKGRKAVPTSADLLLRDRECALATLEIVADRELAERLVRLAKALDRDVVAGRLLTTEDVFGE